jgi:N-methylhydantoinase A
MNGAEMVLGIDVGGTFTDVISVDPETGAVAASKSPTRPGAMLEGIRAAVDGLDVSWDGVSGVVHGTTICTNALIERTQARTGFIGTRGFTDEFDIQRMARRWAATPQACVYDFHQRKPDPVIPRHLRRGVLERMAYPGVVVTELDEQGLNECAQELADEGVEALAVCFLWSSANPAHEQRAKELLRSAFPGLDVSISADVAPVVREYERMVTTAVNASLMPIMSRYLTTIQRDLQALGFGGELMLMQSHGGITSPETLAGRPALTLRSGPVGGAVAAAWLARSLDLRTALACDIGGTSCDTTLIREFAIPLTDRSEVDFQPVVVPTADIRCIGAGGGSIAWLDSGGALRVGPQSAGSTPGPACYGRGGTAPTLTDANLVLGRIGEQTLGHGSIRLSLGAARDSMRELSRHLGRDVDATADAIVTIAVANMAESVRLQTVDRGHDPRELTLVAFGGAGPLHATLLAEACAIEKVVIPREPGVFSALGMVLADRAISVQAGLLSLLAELDPVQLADRYAALEAEARALLGGSQSDGEVRITRSAAMRYELQEWELRVDVTGATLDDGARHEFARAFHAAHLARFGFAREDKQVELVTLYLDAAIAGSPVAYGAPDGAGSAPQGALTRNRSVRISSERVAPECPVFERVWLAAGATMSGPCVIEEPSATTFLQPGWTIVVDDAGNLLARREAGA